ncbi:cation:proton antiporter [Polymorphobacter fuscus]|uniref:Sodium:proton exchanger n=1 Tax=Sandarakinorhabdus fusca TaxID=1439888 RepID=A0A7C9KH57_9SPHN|nr:cation:proton antiporter [Polymorphobacter fuscus]KAB7648573.1 sodium:proton exchanger [Polymorphobacter fuscus]MQT16119.1 sodium:proton exchanger [Polymorphobacter fuscus]NJC07602.1 CPA2 family monovalent cation:H+ antiporter-2 [Polymorphobacter fuscus]
MSLPIESSAFKDIVIVLGAAGLVIPAFAALRISPVVGFILIGIGVGPFGLGALAEHIPLLGAFSISDAEVLAAPAEIGICLLLFALGLELSVDRLRTMRKLVFGVGTAQIVACAAALMLAMLPLGLGAGVTAAFAIALTMSSTAVGLQMLSASGRMGTQAGRTSFGILLAQDIAIAPILLLITAGSARGGFFPSLGMGLLAIAGIMLAGRLVVPTLFLQAARTRRPELFLAASLVVLIGSAAAATSVGISPAIGALIAGAMLAETDYRRQIEAAIAPFQGLLLGVFLIWVGMQLDLAAVVADPLLVIGGVIAVCVVKGLTMFAVLRRFGRGAGVSAHVAALLAAPSETSLILLGTASAIGLTGGQPAQTALLITGLALALAPLLGILGQRLEAHLGHAPSPERHDEIPVPGRTIIIGFGRVGQLVAAMLDAHGKPYLAVDSDPDEVARLRLEGRSVVYGDARRPELLSQLGLESARAVVLTIDAAQSLETLVRLIRERYPDLSVVVRARDADHASQLYNLGASEAVPETVESSLQLAEAVLVDLGVAMGPVIASIHEKRAELRERIQAGANQRIRPTLRSRARSALPREET